MSENTLKKHLNDRSHRPYNFDKRLKYLLTTTFWFVVSILLFSIFYSNADKLNQKDIFFLNVGGILLLITLYLLVKYGIRFFKEMWNLLKRQKNWVIYLAGIILFIILFMLFLNKGTAMDPLINTIEETDFSKFSPLDLNNQDNSLSPSVGGSLNNQETTINKENNLGETNLLNSQSLPKTFIFLVLIWGGYYLLKKKRKFFRKNKKILSLILISISLILISKHIPINSGIGEFFDWILFLAISINSIFGSLLGIRWVNTWNMADDMNIWGLRLFGGLLFFVGFLVLFTGSFAPFISSLYNGQALASSWSPWILGLSLMFWGGFCAYRSSRRHQIVGIWRA